MRRRAAIAVALSLAVGCGSPPPPSEGHVPKIYAFDQQEKAAQALRLGDEAEAEAAATRAIEHDPGFLPSYVTKATAQARQGKLAEAAATLDACLTQQPGFAEAHLLRGALREELKQQDAARADYEQAVAGYVSMMAEHPRDEEVVLKHAIAQYLRGGTAGLQAINRMVEQFPDFPRAQIVRDRMVAKDRAFAFRWLTEPEPQQSADTPAADQK